MHGTSPETSKQGWEVKATCYLKVSISLVVTVFLGFMVPEGEGTATSGYGGDSQTGGESPKSPSGLDSQPALSLQDWQLLAGDW